MTFQFVSCINLMNISLLTTLYSATVFHLFSGHLSHRPYVHHYISTAFCLMLLLLIHPFST